MNNQQLAEIKDIQGLSEQKNFQEINGYQHLFGTSI
jgi:hypothetical protein